jgi:hypothetical protein
MRYYLRDHLIKTFSSTNKKPSQDPKPPSKMRGEAINSHISPKLYLSRDPLL